ncbi:MAG TPA: hypothetical protein O0X97_03195 [Methanocorpusculum sp.]|nr:hypothetical protein [Methanocorpusculum sp.]
MKKAVVIFGIAAVLVAAVCAAGCIASDPLVGEWTTDDSGTLGLDCIYKADGTGSCSVHLAGISASVAVTWEKVSDGQYKVSTNDEVVSALQSVLPGDGIMDVTFSDDRKTAIMEGITFTRKV